MEQLLNFGEKERKKRRMNRTV